MASIYTPLEQFELLVLLPLYLGYFDFSFTNFSFYGFLILALFYLFIFVFYEYAAELVPVRVQLILELLYGFVLGVLVQQVGSKGKKYFPLFFVIFNFIFFCNLFGLIPYSFTLTSHISATFLLAFSLNFGFFLIGFGTHGFHFFSFFVPKGIPKALLPLIVVIEVFSYIIRTFSLSIRLFTNMTAGHTLLHMLASFSLVFLKNSAIFLFLFSVFLICSIFVLELGISFLQAYVFLVLACIYLNDALNLH